MIGLYTIAFNVISWCTKPNINGEIKEKSFIDLKSFLLLDGTDMIKYSKEFNCVNISKELIFKLSENGFISCPSVVYYVNSTGFESGHMLVTVKTKDKGLVYVEPQDDSTTMNLSEWYNYTSYRNCFE